jgi:hypothetical protein
MINRFGYDGKVISDGTFTSRNCAERLRILI